MHCQMFNLDIDICNRCTERIYLSMDRGDYYMGEFVDLMQR